MRLLAVSHAAILDVNRPLFAELARRGHHVLLVTPDRWKNDYGDEPLRVQPLATDENRRLTLSSGAVLKAGSTAFQCYLPLAWPFLMRWRPDIMLVIEEPWSIATLQWTLCARLLGVHVIVRTEENRLRSFPPPFSWINKFTLAKAAHVFGTSMDAVAALAAQGIGAKASVFPHAVDTGLFSPSPNPRHLASVGSTLTIGYIGRIVPAKGVETLLQAAALLAGTATTRPLEVHIIGTGDDVYLASLRRLEEALHIPAGVVRWRGAVAHEQVPDALRALDVLVVPTVAYKGYKEQFGRVVVEALACRVPVVVSDNGELPVLARTTSGGLVFPEGDAPALAACLRQLIDSEDLRRALGEGGYAAAQARYTYDALATTFERTAASL